VGPFLALPVSPSLLELLIMTKVIVIVYRLTNQNGINHSNNYQPHKKKEIFRLPHMHYTQNMENSYFNSTFVYNAIYSFVPSANSNAILMTTIQIYKSANFITYCCTCIEYTLPWAGFKLITLVIIGTDCTGSCKSNYHTITTMMTPNYLG
jgi:hypothetical protein